MNRLLSLLGLFLIAGSACTSPAPTQQTSTPAPAASAAPAGGPVTAGWTVTDAVDAPESVYVDPGSGSIFVSIIGGMPGDRDGNGRIMKLAPDGKVVAAMWVTGLNAPKGLRSYNGTLWTADIDQVVAIDIASGRVTSKLKIDGDRLLVAGRGKPEADFTTKVPGRLFVLDLKTKQKTLITPKPFGNIDGLELDGRGGYLLTDYQKGQLIDVTSGGESTILRQFKPGTADLAFVPASRIAIVPHMNENKIAAYDLSDVLK